MQEGKDGPSSSLTTDRWPYFSEGLTETTELEEAAVTSQEPHRISVKMCTGHVHQECVQCGYVCIYFVFVYWYKYLVMVFNDNFNHNVLKLNVHHGSHGLFL